MVAIREHYADGHQETWLLIDTKENPDPSQAPQEYHLRTSIEETYRQKKCFADLTGFTSRSFSLVTNQVVFTFLAHNLLQLFLRNQGRQELNHQTWPRARRQLLPATSHIVVYWQNYYGLFNSYELIEIIATLEDEPRKKVAEKSRRLRLETSNSLRNPRAP